MSKVPEDWRIVNVPTFKKSGRDKPVNHRATSHMAAEGNYWKQILRDSISDGMAGS